MPKYFDIKKSIKLIPDDAFVLVGYSKTEKRFKCYDDRGKYIFRMDGAKGSVELDNEVVNAKYLLLRRNGKETASDLYRIKSKGPKVYSTAYLDSLNYPKSDNPKDYYLSIEIEKLDAKDFINTSFNFKELEEYKKVTSIERNPRINVGMPFTVTLTELLRKKTIDF
ncbi:hypothetical protein [Halpernia sp. GG3]